MNDPEYIASVINRFSCPEGYRELRLCEKLPYVAYDRRTLRAFTVTDFRYGQLGNESNVYESPVWLVRPFNG
jgi:hypothetical protein